MRRPPPPPSWAPPPLTSPSFTKWNGSVVSQVHSGPLDSPIGAVAASLWNEYSAFGRDIFAQKHATGLQIACNEGLITLRPIYDYLLIFLADQGAPTGLVNLQINELAGWLRDQLSEVEGVLTRGAAATEEI